MGTSPLRAQRTQLCACNREQSTGPCGGPSFLGPHQKVSEGQSCPPGFPSSTSPWSGRAGWGVSLAGQWLSPPPEHKGPNTTSELEGCSRLGAAERCLCWGWILWLCSSTYTEVKWNKKQQELAGLAALVWKLLCLKLCSVEERSSPHCILLKWLSPHLVTASTLTAYFQKCTIQIKKRL